DHIVELTCRIRGSEGAHRALALRCGLDARSGALVIAGREASPLEEMRAQRDDARRRLAALFETMHDLVFTTDESGVLNGVNRVPAGLTLAETIGAPMLSFAAPEEQELMRSRYDEVRQRGKLVAYETVAMYPDGTKAN